MGLGYVLYHIMLWLVFSELQKVVGEFYFPVLGEVNRNRGKNADRKRRISGVWSGNFMRGMCGEEDLKSAAGFF